MIKNKDHLTFLLQYVDINSQNEEGNTLLHSKIYYENQIKVFVQNGADVNQANEAGETAIFKAINSKMKPIVRILIKHKANVLHYNRKRQTPLTLAISKKNISIVKLLIQSEAYSVDSKAFQEALNEAKRFKKQSPEILIYLQGIKNADTKKIKTKKLDTKKLDTKKLDTKKAK